MKFFPERLKSARKMRGLSMDKLAEQMQGRVSKQAISKYEQGKMKPDSQALMALCEALELRPDYFMRASSLSLDTIEFRKLQRTKIKSVDQIKAHTLDFLERYLELEYILGEEQSFTNPLSNNTINTPEQIEKAAEEVRRQWELGHDPLPNVTGLLEEQGIKVLEIEADSNFSGLSTFAGNIPVIVLNKSLDQVPDRKRFTALHELAHLLFNFNGFDKKTIEKLCHRFAGAFLLPGAVLVELLGEHRRHIALPELGAIKENFGISMQAIISRAADLGIVSGDYLKRFFMWFRKSGHHKQEPWQYRGYEKAGRFERLLYHALAEELISMSKAAALSNQKLSTFRKSLPDIF